MDNILVGTYIKSRLKDKGITQEQLAEMLNISSSAVSQVLNGKNMFDYPNMIHLAKILDESLDKIVNAGVEPETYLEELSKLSSKEYLMKDPTFEKLKDTDSKGLTLKEYLLKNKNHELVLLLQEKGLLYKIETDIRYATMIINNNDEKNYQRFLSQHTFLHDLEKDVHSLENLKLFDSYTSDEQEYIKAIVECKNDNILNGLSFLRKIREGSSNSFAILYYAIQFDQIDFLKFMEFKQNLNEPKLRHVKTNLYSNYLHMAIQYKSMRCLKYLYDGLVEFHIDKYISTLGKTKDVLFIKDFFKNFQSKTHDRYYQTQPETYNTYQSLKNLILDNEVQILEYLLDLSDQDSLDQLMRETSQTQIELIKLLLRKGARFTFYDSYQGKYFPNEQITALMKDLYKIK
jgi:transcriptional regulator with XRE-family HTH domain